MLPIHEFWVELFPMFEQDYAFVYIFFDVATIIIFIRALLILPSLALLGRNTRGGGFKW